MSANNGVFILKTKDNYRVAYSGCVDNLLPDKYRKFDATEIVRAFKDARMTKDFETAYRIAKLIEHKAGYVEYGIKIIEYNKTWWKIVKDAETASLKYMRLRLDK